MGINWAKKEKESESFNIALSAKGNPPEINLIEHPTVEIVHITPNNAEIIEWAGRQSTATKSKGEAEKFVRARVREKHLSLGRFAIASFEIKCSLFTEKQLLRHKFLDFCIQSGRYTKFEPNFILPQSIAQKPKALKKYIEECSGCYTNYLDKLKEGVKKEDARISLPVSTITSIAVVGNFQAWYNFLDLRLHKSAQWEIRWIATLIGLKLLNHAPSFFFEFNGVFDGTTEIL